MVTIEEEWLYEHRDEMQSRYGVGTFVAVYDWAVIDWGSNSETVRARAEAAIGDAVFVGVVPAEPADDAYPTAAEFKAWEGYRARFEAAGDKRRFRLGGFDGWEKIAELDITGEKTEFVDGVVIIDGIERRYADHDYRLLVEHGIVSKETELIAGVIYRKKGARPPDARKLDPMAKPGEEKMADRNVAPSKVADAGTAFEPKVRRSYNFDLNKGPLETITEVRSQNAAKQSAQRNG